MINEELRPSKITGDTSKPSINSADINKYARELGLTLEEFMKRYYLTTERIVSKKITISNNKK